MRAAITGCAGFIGAHLSQHLLEDGWSVIGIDALRPYYDSAEKVSSLAPLRRHPRFEFLHADLVDTSLHDVFADVDRVFHLAAQPGVRGSFGDTFDQYVHDNVKATQRVFEAALATEVPRVVYASSSSVYGDAQAYPCKEGETPRAPRSPYGVTKATCEDLADVYRNLGLASVGLRYFTVYGPRQRPDMAMRRLCEAALGGPIFQLFGDGLQSRDFTHVSDAVDATIKAALASDPAPVLNIGGGQEATMLEVIDIISGFAGSSLSIEPGQVQRGDVRRTGADGRVARETIGWSPKVRLTEGLRSEFEWVRERRAAERELDLRFTPGVVLAGDAP